MHSEERGPGSGAPPSLVPAAWRGHQGSSVGLGLGPRDPCCLPPSHACVKRSTSSYWGGEGAASALRVCSEGNLPFQRGLD